MRALLLDAGGGQAAASAARALVAAGWEVDLGSPVAAPLARARTVRRRYPVPWPAHGPRAALAAVDAAVVDGGHGVVLPCGDDWVALLDEHAADRPWSPYRRSVGGALRCLDKLELARAAAAVGLRTPRTLAADDAALTAWEGPAVVKARSHWLPTHGDPRQRLEARLVDRGQEARPFVELAEAAGGAAVLQEPVAGALGAVVGLVHDGRFVRVAQQRADLVWPQPTGVTARARTVVPDATLVARAGALAGHLGHEGLLQVEVLHPLDGTEPVVIDCNPRCYGSLALAEAAGLGATAAWARWVADGATPAPAEARVDATYLWTEGAVRAALANRGDGPRQAVAAVTGALRGWRSAAHPVWDPADPGPALRAGLQLVGRALRRAAGGGS